MPTTAASRGRPLRSASAIVAGTERGEHLLKIIGYSRTKDHLPTGSHIKSRSFHVGGHGWHILYYPNGESSSWSDYISIRLKLDNIVPKGVRAQYRFVMLNNEGKPVPHRTLSGESIFRDVSWGWGGFIKRKEELERSEEHLLRDDSFTIRCELTVMKEIQTEDIDVDVHDGATPKPPPPPATVVVPPPDLHRHLGGLLATGEAADVAFDVDGRTFPAHRAVLVARSPVLRAQLSALQEESGGAVVVRIDDMEARDFEAFLHYVYTDSLPPSPPDADADDAAAMMLPDLVAASNRYGMERLKLLCEDKLCGHVNVRTVAAMLAFAGEQRCDGLREACLRFIQDPRNLKEVVKAHDLEQLRETCPSVFKDLVVAKLAGDAG